MLASGVRIPYLIAALVFLVLVILDYFIETVDEMVLCLSESGERNLPRPGVAVFGESLFLQNSTNFADGRLCLNLCRLLALPDR